MPDGSGQRPSRAKRPGTRRSTRQTSTVPARNGRSPVLRDRLTFLAERWTTEAGLSQKQLAERVHTKQPSIARLERARVLPKLDLLQRVARALGAEVVVSFRRIPSNRRRNRVASATR